MCRKIIKEEYFAFVILEKKNPWHGAVADSNSF